MKIAVLSNCDKDIANERRACKKIIQYLRKTGNEVFEITPEDMFIPNKDLQSQILKASTYGVELIISCYFNFQSKEGCKIMYNRTSKLARKYAIRMAAFVEKLGFVNRGAKENSKIIQSGLPVIIIEPIL